MVDIRNITTIKLEKETKSRLSRLKVHKRESYEEVLQKILSILNALKDNPLKARIKLQEIDILRKKIRDFRSS